MNEPIISATEYGSCSAEVPIHANNQTKHSNQIKEDDHESRRWNTQSVLLFAALLAGSVAMVAGSVATLKSNEPTELFTTSDSMELGSLKRKRNRGISSGRSGDDFATSNNQDDNLMSIDGPEDDISSVTITDDRPEDQQSSGGDVTGDTGVAFEATNKYISKYGDIGEPYPWVDAPVLEPYRESTLTLVGATDEYQYHWKIRKSTDKNTTERFIGEEVKITFMDVDIYEVSISEHDSNGNKISSTGFIGKIIVRYVRREIRSLDDDDRDLFMKSCAIVWAEPMETGILKYGAQYTDIKYLAGLHNKLAGDRDCDHMHDGLGFLTQHSGLTYLFEKSLQSINPGVTVPYWDWTIDVARNSAANMTNDAIWNWNVWNSEYFGSGLNKDHTVADGTWAYTLVSVANWNDTHNPYGYMRAPWNTNSNPWVTRYNYTGSKLNNYASTDMGMPNCLDFWTLLMECDTWFDFGWAMPYNPHARVHSVIGGSESGPSFDVLSDYFDETILEDISKLQFSWTKNLWRNYKIEFPSYCSSDTPQHQCTGSCTFLDLAHKKGSFAAYIDTFGDEVVIAAFNTLGNDDQYKALGALCENGLSIGDQMESASPADISFWPIHPNLERIWMIKKLSSTFQNESWPETGTSLATDTTASGECYGHGPYDLLPYGDIYGSMDNLADKNNNLTNKGLYNLMDPMNSDLPYVYDDFSLKHCQHYDIDFGTWLPSQRR